MRRLTADQKKILDKAWDEYQPRDVDELSHKHWDDIEYLNPTEILWQEVNRYLSDLSFNSLRINQIQRAEQDESLYPRNNKGPFAPF